MQASARVSAGRGFASECEAARVFCRLAALHDDDDYRAAAVIAPTPTIAPTRRGCWPRCRRARAPKARRSTASRSANCWP
jgi:hypothetical protein